MTFLYQPSKVGENGSDRVRFEIGDTVKDDGPLPDDANLQDEEIASLFLIEASFECVVAACFERISSAWQSRPFIGVNEFGTEHGRVAEGFMDKAKMWRGRCLQSKPDAVRERRDWWGYVDPETGLA